MSGLTFEDARICFQALNRLRLEGVFKPGDRLMLYEKMRKIYPDLPKESVVEAAWQQVAVVFAERLDYIKEEK